jgi:hypothetical protein
MSVLLLCTAVLLTEPPKPSANSVDPPKPTDAKAPALAGRQTELAARFRAFEARLRQAAEVLKALDPQRSVLATRAASKAKSALIAVQLERIAKSLADAESAAHADDAASLGRVVAEQKALLAELDALLDVLLSDDRSRLGKDKREAIERRLKEIDALRREQLELQAATDRDASRVAKLAEAQGDLADRTEKAVPQDENGADGKGAEGGDTKAAPSGDGKKAEPSEADDLRDAKRAMDRAKRAIENKKKSQASKAQAEAVKKLAATVERLSRVLRQLREEERLQALMSLEARVQRLLEGERGVAERVGALTKTPTAERTRADLKKAAELAAPQQALAAETEKTLQIVREDNVAVAFDESLTLVRDDMTRVANRLRDADLGPPTVTTIASLLATLEDMTAALQREIKETRERQEEGEGGGGQTNAALLDRLAELRLVASLQRQIEKRTALVAELAAQGQSAAEVQETLRQLAARQARVYEIAKEIAARTQP